MGKPNIHPAEANNVKLAINEGPGRGFESKVPVEIRNDVTRKPGGEASRERSGGAAEEKGSSTLIGETFTSKSRPLFLKFFSRWLSSFSLSAMLALLFALDVIKRGNEASFQFLFLSSSFADYFLQLSPRCILGMPVAEGSLSLRRGRVGNPPALPLAPLTAARLWARIVKRNIT